MARLELVEHWWQAIVLRSIRNECRDFMTRDRRKIGMVDQARWYFTKYRPSRNVGKAFAYVFYSHDVPVGYAYVEPKEDGAWITGGLRERYRGRGLGRGLFEAIVNAWSEEGMMLEVLDTNKVAKKLYRSLGFVKKDVRDHGRVIIMRRPKKRKDEGQTV